MNAIAFPNTIEPEGRLGPTAPKTLEPARALFEKQLRTGRIPGIWPQVAPTTTRRSRPPSADGALRPRTPTLRPDRAPGEPFACQRGHADWRIHGRRTLPPPGGKRVEGVEENCRGFSPPWTAPPWTPRAQDRAPAERRRPVLSRRSMTFAPRRPRPGSRKCSSSRAMSCGSPRCWSARRRGGRTRSSRRT